MANETMESVNPELLNYGLIVLNVVPLVLFVVNVVRLKLNRVVDDAGKGKVVSSTAVVPIQGEKELECKTWGLMDTK